MEGRRFRVPEQVRCLAYRQRRLPEVLARRLTSRLVHQLLKRRSFLSQLR